MIFQHVKMAINSLKSNKIRTILTLLGVIIGVMSVTTIIGLGEGIKKQVNSQISSLGDDLITVVPGRASAGDTIESITGLFGNNATSSRLSESDLDSVNKIDNVSQVSGIMQLDGSSSVNSRKKNIKIIATGEHYLKLNNLKLYRGQFFGGDLENNLTTVLSRDLSEYYFGDQDPIGSSVKLRGKEFIVVGVLDKQNGLNIGRELKDTAIIPLPVGKSLNQNSVQLQQITVQVSDKSKIDTTSKQIESALKKDHGGEEDFTITTQSELIDTTDYVFRLLTGFTAAVASISLLVGGIGVMNIMLVTVTERTREIGVRKAVGATRFQIMMQFLVESLAITLLGGILGIAASLVAGSIIRAQTSIQPALDIWIILVAIMLSVIVGLIFGTWPAIRASTKDPIESLRHD